MTVCTRGSPPEDPGSIPVQPQPPPTNPSQEPEPAVVSSETSAESNVTVVHEDEIVGSVERHRETFFEKGYSSAPHVSPSSSPRLSVPEDDPGADHSNSSVDVINEDGSDDPDGDPPVFPVATLQSLDEQLNRQRWVVPVLPGQELHVLIDSAIKLCKKGLDTNDEACQRFYKDSLLLSFTRVMNDEAVKEWKHEILRHIYKLNERCVELCVFKLEENMQSLMEILSLLFNARNKYYSVSQLRQADFTEEMLSTRRFFAASPESGPPKGWLVDLLNKFGQLGGFQKILDRFKSGSDLSCIVICSYLKPFGQCYEYLSSETVETYLQEPIRCAHRYMQNMSDEELKRETKGDARESSPMEIVRYLRNLSTRLPGQDNIVRDLELLRLKIILRILQTSSFAGKMNALNEISKILQSVSSSSSTYGPAPLDEYLNIQQVVSWIRDNDLLNVAIKENLHIIQYVEKLEKILRFMIKEKILTINDLDQLWAAHIGKHDAIVKNIHDLLAKVAWDFTAEQLDHLFGCFQRSWNDAGKKQREKLLELIRRLAEDDRDGRCADKVLQLLWSFACDSDIPTDIMDQALQCHAKILDYSCSSQKETRKIMWMERCIEEMRRDKWALAAMKHFRDICVQFPEGPNNTFANWTNATTQYNRGTVIGTLQKSHNLVGLMSSSLVRYMDMVRRMVEEHEKTSKDGADRAALCRSLRVDGHYDHAIQVNERLSFLMFILRDGQLWLCDPQASEIWNALVVHPVFQLDREAGFKWFGKIMGQTADLDPTVQRQFFEGRLLQLDPSLLTEAGMKCFDRFFKQLNQVEYRLIYDEQRHHWQITTFDLIGQEYLWRVILSCSEDIADTAIELIREVHTNPSPAVTVDSGKVIQLHVDFIQSCMDRLKASYDTLSVLCGDKDSSNLIHQETVRMTRVLRVLRGYIVSYDEQCNEDRAMLPLYRASLGRSIDVTVNFANVQGKRQPFTPVQRLEMLTHSNQTLGGLKRRILHQIRMPPPAANVGQPLLIPRLDIDLLLNGELLDPVDDKKTLEELGLFGRLELQAKLRQIGQSGGPVENGSSPGSSSGDSSPGVGSALDKVASGECESILPSTWLCQKHEQINFLLRIADLGAKLESAKLRDWSRAVLDAIPGDVALMKKIIELTEQSSPQAGTVPSISKDASCSPTGSSLQSVLFASSPSEVLYSLELMYSMLAPAADLNADGTLAFQTNFVKAGGIQACLSTLLRNNFLCQTDAATKATAFLYVLRLLRVLLSVVINVRCAAYTTSLRSGQLTDEAAQVIKAHCDYMNTFFNVMPSYTDALCQAVCAAWAEQLVGVKVLPEENYPELDHARFVIKLAWAAAGDTTAMTPDESHTVCLKKADLSFPKHLICRDALEVFILCVILNPSIMGALQKEKFFQQAIIDLLFCSSDCVRVAAGEFFYCLATKSFAVQPRNLHFFLTLLSTVLFSATSEKSGFCRDYFGLLHGLLMFASGSRVSFAQAESLLEKEVGWLKEARSYSITNAVPYPHDDLLEGHLMVTRALIGFLPPDKKHYIGSAMNGPMLVQQLLEDFLLPSSRMFIEQKSQPIHRSMTIMGRMGESPNNRDPSGTAMMPRSLTTIYSPSRCVPVCGSAHSVTEAYELVVALCTNCVPNMQTVYGLFNEMYFDDSMSSVSEWEYAPLVSLRNTSTFVGLKNGGATCYMNAVFQQLFMLEKLRNSVLSSCSPNYTLEDSDNEEGVIHGPLMRRSPSPTSSGDLSQSATTTSTEKTPADSRKEYNMGILQCVQLIFANLLGSQLQFYVPRKFWKQFRFGNELINLREQHDALEFFNSLVDSVDEALKTVGEEQICNKIFGGTFADQKICKGCPHRYTREEPFTTLSLDVRNHHSMVDSLQEYVKGDLLESENAYLCEKCNRKVDAVKRLCIKKLPPILVIQLKRFDFDWEREQAVKFNDYFEFPREVDMEPYTVDGLAKLEGEVLTDSENNEKERESPPPPKTPTTYKLRGVIVHSGQASGGHYYSFIQQRSPSGQLKWYKFDDGDVTECRMDDDEEMRAQCFGGEYTSEVFDQYLRRLQQRRHKRWWNAYILFYERADADIAMSNINTAFQSMSLSGPMRQMPAALEDIVNRKNMKCCHKRNQYTVEFFHFIRQLCCCHVILYRTGLVLLEDSNFQMLLLLSVQLVSKFLFTTGLRAKRNLRGNPQEWIDIMTWLFRLCPTGRVWFASEILYKNRHRFAEYLLESPSADVRLIFARILANLAHFGGRDAAASVQNAPEHLYKPQDRLSDLLVRTVLSLLQKEVSDYGRHLKKRQLLMLGVPSLFIRVILDDGPGPPIKSISMEFQKLYSTISLLIRSCDVSTISVGETALCATSDGSPVKPNPWRESINNSPIMPIPQDLVVRLYDTPSKFLKKLLDEAINFEETMTLVKFLCWENIHFTKMVFSALLQQVRYGCPDFRPLLECLLQVLLLDDSWAEKRVIITLRGSEEQEGMFQFIHLQIGNNPRRAYLLTKMLVGLFDASPVALRVLYSDGDMKRRWNDIMNWMHSELAGRPSFPSAYGYSSWSPPGLSNETITGNYLERTKSAKLTLTKIMQIAQNWPKDEREESPSGGQSDEDAPAGTGDQFGDTMVMGSIGAADIPSHPPPPYSPNASPPHSPSGTPAASTGFISASKLRDEKMQLRDKKMQGMDKYSNSKEEDDIIEDDIIEDPALKQSTSRVFPVPPPSQTQSPDKTDDQQPFRFKSGIFPPSEQD